MSDAIDRDAAPNPASCETCKRFFAPAPPPKPCAPDDPLEVAFWDFDARRKGYAEWKGAPQSERDAFKATIRSLPAVPPSPAERLARAAEFAALVASDLHPSESMGVAAWDEALAAYRAAPPAAEPSSFQKPPGSLDEGAVRGNNPEPAPCGTCGGSGNVGSPCPDGARFIDGVRVSCAVMHSRPCPSCRPGGAA